MARLENLQEAIDMWNDEKDFVFLNDYPFVLQSVKDAGFSVVYDIGSGFGPHVEYACQEGFRYIGIDESESPVLWDYRKDLIDLEKLNAEFMFGKKVPFSGFVPEKNSCAISICALGSLYGNSDEVIGECMEFVTANFKHFWCSTFPESLKKMKKYWDHTEVLRDDCRSIYHFWNDDKNR